MSKDLNQCNFIGRLGRDPEIKYLPDGKAVANFSIACGDDYKAKDGQKVEQTNWVNIVAFGRLAEIIGEYCSKGSRVFVSGKQVTRKWQHKSTGEDRYATEIVASEMQLLDSRGATADNPKSPRDDPQDQRETQAQGGGFDDFDDDIGF